eukprot:1161932-Pelagomonas_calceolata.AAC.13
MMMSNLCLCSLSPGGGCSSLASNSSGLYYVPECNCFPSSTLIAAHLGAIYTVIRLPIFRGMKVLH